MRKCVFLFTTTSFILSTSCEKKHNNVNSSENNEVYRSGIYIANEGQFRTGSGSVSYYDPTSKSVKHHIFEMKNGFPLGNVVQSISFHNNQAFIVINNSGLVEVVNDSTFESIESIGGFSSPRYMLPVDATTIYVSDWISNEIKVIDLSDFSIKSTITTGLGPEKMVMTSNANVWIVNSGGFSSDNRISVINSNNHSLVQTITVGDNPNSLAVDVNGKVWVLCGGINDFNNPQNNTAGKLMRINPNSYTIELELGFSSTKTHPVRLTSNSRGDALYYLSNQYDGELYEFDITASPLPVKSLVNRSFYSLSFDLVRDEIYTSNAMDFSQSGWVYRYRPTGTVVDSFKAGVIPGNFAFK